MSDGSFGPSYSFFGVISHAGGGPSSGHYYAHVKDGLGGWYEMNDDSVTRIGGPPLSLKNAYVLFYLKNKGQALESAISTVAREPPKGGLVAGMKKRKLPHEADEDTGVRTSPVVSRPSTPTAFIGPLLPSPSIPSPSKKRKQSNLQDPQAEALRKKIEALTGYTQETGEKQAKKAPEPTSALQDLSQYADDDEEDEGEAPSEEEIKKAKEKLPVPSVASTISTSNFYGNGGSTNVAPPLKNKSNSQQLTGSPKRARSEGAGLLKKKTFVRSPYSGLNGSSIDNLRSGGITIQQHHSGKRRKRLII